MDQKQLTGQNISDGAESKDHIGLAVTAAAAGGKAGMRAG